MKKYDPSTSGVLTLILVTLLIGACARTQIDTKLPASHPARPTAEDAVFVPPPNPFMMSTFDIQPTEKPTGPDDGARPAEHPIHEKDTGHGHGRPMMAPQGDAPAGSLEKTTEHQH